MQVSFTKEETIKLIEEYYKKLEDRVVTVSITSKKGNIGWQDEEACVTTVTVSEKMEIAGMEKQVKEIVTEDQLTVLLRAVFELYEFDLTSLTINDGFNSRWEGYGCNEHEVKSAFCKGITVNVKKKKNHSLGKKPKTN